jgi:hypothetical protein
MSIHHPDDGGSQGRLKRKTYTRLHGATTQKTAIFIERRCLTTIYSGEFLTNREKITVENYLMKKLAMCTLHLILYG